MAGGLLRVYKGLRAAGLGLGLRGEIRSSTGLGGCRAQSRASGLQANRVDGCV